MRILVAFILLGLSLSSCSALKCYRCMSVDTKLAGETDFAGSESGSSLPRCDHGDNGTYGGEEACESSNQKCFNANGRMTFVRDGGTWMTRTVYKGCDTSPTAATSGCLAGSDKAMMTSAWSDQAITDLRMNNDTTSVLRETSASFCYCETDLCNIATQVNAPSTSMMMTMMVVVIVATSVTAALTDLTSA